MCHLPPLANKQALNDRSAVGMYIGAMVGTSIGCGKYECSYLDQKEIVLAGQYVQLKQATLVATGARIVKRTSVDYDRLF